MVRQSLTIGVFVRAAGAPDHIAGVVADVVGLGKPAAGCSGTGR